MASEGPLFPDSGVNDASVGAVAWGNPGNVVSDNGATASFQDFSAPRQSHYLLVTDFDFAVADGNTIDGIVVRLGDTSVAFGTVTDTAIRIVKGGVIGSTDRSVGTWSGSGHRDYGGVSDLWGETPTPADIRSTGFGVAISVSSGAEVVSSGLDYVTITVHYTEEGAAAVAKQLVNGGLVSRGLVNGGRVD